jgi:predicted transcriptional regulator
MAQFLQSVQSAKPEAAAQTRDATPESAPLPAAAAAPATLEAFMPTVGAAVGAAVAAAAVGSPSGSLAPAAMQAVIGLLVRHQELPVPELLAQSRLDWNHFRTVLDSLQSKGVMEFIGDSAAQRVRLTEKGLLLRDVFMQQTT